MIVNTIEIMNKQHGSLTYKGRKCPTKEESLSMIKLLLRKNSASVYIRDEGGMTPVLRAATASYVHAIHAIVSEFPDSAEMRDFYGQTILHLVKIQGRYEDAKFLMEIPQIVRLKNRQDCYGNTPVFVIVKDIIEQQQQQQEAQMSCEFGMLKALLDSSADLTIKNKERLSVTALIHQHNINLSDITIFQLTSPMADAFNLLQMYQDDDDNDDEMVPESHLPDHVEVRDSDTQVGDGVDVDSKDIDPLDKFLPPPPQEKCSDELQEKINKFLAYKRQGKSFNVEVRNRKDYRNPDFLRHAVRYQDIDEIGSCFSKDVFDPHGYDETDFYDAIEAAIIRERKMGQGVSILPSGGSQSASAESIPREGRHNKKSKWDKVDGDRTSVLGGGHENVSAIAAHAALLSAANAVYAQQKRREAEERRK